jgi:3-deoxy-7-phosphoheptulonate synthase
VPALSRAAVAIGADGIIVEVHPNPAKAVSDGAQSLDIPMFNEMMRDMAPYVDIWRRSRVTEYAAVV